jgi:predicted nuclease with TOPRIM domain
MSDAETAAILEKAEGCMGEECSIDEVDELLVMLKKTQSDLEERLEKIMNLVGDLQHLNQKGERETDEVRAFVKDMLSVFSRDVSVILLCMQSCFCQLF